MRRRTGSLRCQEETILGGHRGGSRAEESHHTSRALSARAVGAMWGHVKKDFMILNSTPSEYRFPSPVKFCEQRQLSLLTTDSYCALPCSWLVMQVSQAVAGKSNGTVLGGDI